MLLNYTKPLIDTFPELVKAELLRLIVAISASEGSDTNNYFIERAGFLENLSELLFS